MFTAETIRKRRREEKVLDLLEDLVSWAVNEEFNRRDRGNYPQDVGVIETKRSIY